MLLPGHLGALTPFPLVIDLTPVATSREVRAPLATSRCTRLLSPFFILEAEAAARQLPCRVFYACRLAALDSQPEFSFLYIPLVPPLALSLSLFLIMPCCLGAPSIKFTAFSFAQPPKKRKENIKL